MCLAQQVSPVSCHLARAPRPTQRVQSASLPVALKLRFTRCFPSFLHFFSSLIYFFENPFLFHFIIIIIIFIFSIFSPCLLFLVVVTRKFDLLFEVIFVQNLSFLEAVLQELVCDPISVPETEARSEVRPKGDNELESFQFTFHDHQGRKPEYRFRPTWK